MPFDYNTFMALVRQDNPTFKRIALSSELDEIIAEVKNKTFISPLNKEKLEKLVAFLPYDKQQKYARALAYLNQNGGVRIGAIPSNPVMSFDKFLIEKAVYSGWDANGTNRGNIPLMGNAPNSVGVRSFLHRHKLTWSPSNGHTPSLNNVRTREYVKFLADTQAPPFNRVQDPDREFYAPGTMGATGQTFGIDDHSTKLPALICVWPRVAGTLIAQQWYQYSVDNGATWKNIDGAAYLIEKTVRQEGNDWVFVFKKSNWVPHNTKRFHFEVHYTIGNPPQFMPRVDTDVAQGVTEDAKITDYARRVVSLG